MDRSTYGGVVVVFGFVALNGLVLAKALYAPPGAPPSPTVECPPDCDFDAKAVSEVHTLAWHNAYVGAPLDDAELQALSDAQEILRCVAATQDSLAGVD